MALIEYDFFTIIYLLKVNVQKKVFQPGCKNLLLELIYRSFQIFHCKFVDISASSFFGVMRFCYSKLHFLTDV